MAKSANTGARAPAPTSLRPIPYLWRGNSSIELL